MGISDAGGYAIRLCHDVQTPCQLWLEERGILLSSLSLTLQLPSANPVDYPCKYIPLQMILATLLLRPWYFARSFFLVGCTAALLHGLCTCLVLAFCLFPLCHQWILAKSKSTSLLSICSVACIKTEGSRKVQSVNCFTAVSQPLNCFLLHSATLMND